ncbi:MAG: hypothetical protein WB615_09055, partial [Candidatus Tumulicola sp.]
TAATQAAFGGSTSIAVALGFTAAQAAAPATRLVVADLTAAHQQRVDAKLYDGGFAGSHSDINFDEIYQLVMGFLFA